MAENVCAQRAVLKRSLRTIGFRGLLLAGVSLVVICVGDPRFALSQSDEKPQIEASLLPPRTGEPLTIKPLNMQDIDCIVAEWRYTAARPVLTLICPPNSVFSPFVGVFKLLWITPEDLPLNPKHMPPPPGTPTKIRTNKTAAQIWAQVNEKGRPRDTWIGFTAVVDA